jgi:formyltetrahydrofolate hydrolase
MWVLLGRTQWHCLYDLLIRNESCELNCQIPIVMHGMLAA